MKRSVLALMTTLIISACGGEEQDTEIDSADSGYTNYEGKDSGTDIEEVSITGGRITKYTIAQTGDSFYFDNELKFFGKWVFDKGEYTLVPDNVYSPGTCFSCFTDSSCKEQADSVLMRSNNEEIYQTYIYDVIRGDNRNGEIALTVDGDYCYVETSDVFLEEGGVCVEYGSSNEAGIGNHVKFASNYTCIRTLYSSSPAIVEQDL